MRKTGTGRLWTAAAAAVFWTGAVLSGLLLLPALVCCGLSRLIWSAAERLQIALTLHGNPDCQKICQAKSFGGKKSVKGNPPQRQNCKIRAKLYFAILEAAWKKSPRGTF